MPVAGTLSVVIGEIGTSDSVFNLFHPSRFSFPFSDLLCYFKGSSPQEYQIICQLDSFTDPKDYCSTEENLKSVFLKAFYTLLFLLDVSFSSSLVL